MPVTFQVTIGQRAASPFNPDDLVTRTIGPLTPAQAEEMGFDLSTLVSGINAQLATENVALAMRLAEREAALASLCAAGNIESAES